MADIPYGVYNVQLGNSANNWANGALNYSASGMGYKGNNNATNLNASTTDVGWTVSLNHAGNNCSLVFTGGQYSLNPVSNRGQITGGTVTCGCFATLSATPEDTWSADATASEDAEASRKAGA